VFRHPRRTRVLHVYLREGRCRVIASHVVIFVDYVSRRKGFVRNEDAEKIGWDRKLEEINGRDIKTKRRKKIENADGAGGIVKN